MKKSRTALIIALDRSGSMDTIKKDIIGGFNNLIHEQKKLDGECFVHLVDFDYGPFSNQWLDGYRTIYDYVDIQYVKDLDNSTYVPRGGTAIIDSAVHTIDVLGEKFAAMREEARPDRVIFLQINDGQTNSDVRYNYADLSARIKHQTEKYNWFFSYIGSNHDALKEAVKMGISARSSITFSATSVGTNNVYSSTSNLVSSLRSCAVEDMGNISYSAVDRAEAMKDDEDRKLTLNGAQ